MGIFLGHDTFKGTISWNRFLDIRSSIRFGSSTSYDVETASKVPLWFCWSILDQFLRKSAAIAVPVGVSALDENSCPTMARAWAKMYSPNKPHKYGICFYAVVGHKYCYLSSMFDNQAGNQTGIEGVHDYHCLFHILCTPYYNVIGSDRKKDSLADTPSTLWICMMGHQSALHKQQDGTKRCIQCRKGFHVNCFMAFHCRGALSSSRQAVLDVVLTSKKTPTVGKPSKFVPTSIDILILPAHNEP